MAYLTSFTARWLILFLTASLLGWPPAIGGEVWEFSGHADAVTAVAFFSDGKRAASCGEDKTVRLWDLETGDELRQLAVKETALSALAISPDGKTLAAAGRDHVVRLWKVAATRSIKPKRCEGHSDIINQLAFSPDSRLLASTSWDGTVRLWDATTGKELRRCDGHQGSANGVAFAPDGRRLATGGADHTVRIWETATGKEVDRFERHTAWVGDVAYSPDGRSICSAGGKDEPVVLIWSVADKMIERRLPAPPDPGWGVTFGGDGRLLVIQEDAIGVFGPNAEQREERLQGHEGQIYGLAVSPDRTRALTGGADKSVRLWNIANRSGAPARAVADRSVKNSWKRIELWMDNHYPVLKLSLRPGASAKTLLEVEKAIGRPLPADVKESWGIHDGQRRIDYREAETFLARHKSPGVPQAEGIYGNPFLPLIDTEGTPTGVSVLSEWKSRQRLAAPDGAPHLKWTSWPVGAIQLRDSTPGWIPLGFANDSNFFGVDLNPGPDGQVGQVINFGRDQEDKYVIAKSWGEFLADVADELEAGNFTVTPSNEYREFELKRPEAASFFFNRKAWAEAKAVGKMLE